MSCGIYFHSDDDVNEDNVFSAKAMHNDRGDLLSRISESISVAINRDQQLRSTSALCHHVGLRGDVFVHRGIEEWAVQ